MSPSKKVDLPDNVIQYPTMQDVRDVPLRVRITSAQALQLRKEAGKQRLSLSELVRRALEDYLPTTKNNKSRRKKRA